MKSFHCAMLLIVMTALVLSGCSMISKNSIGNNQLALNENASNGESTPPQGESNQPANDPLQYVQATTPSPYYQWIEGNPVGTWAEWEQSTSAGSATTYWAIVGTEGDSIWFEYSQGEWIIRTLVQRTDGTVTRAYAGKTGEVGREIEIQTFAAAQPTGQPKLSTESISVPAGSFSCKKSEFPGGRTTWTSNQNEFGGMVKMVIQTTQFSSTMELLAYEKNTVEVPAGTFECTYSRYQTTNNNKVMETSSWTCPKVPFSHIVQNKTGENQMTLTGYGQDGKARLSIK